MGSNGISSQTDTIYLTVNNSNVATNTAETIHYGSHKITLKTNIFLFKLRSRNTAPDLEIGLTKMVTF